MGKLMGIIVGVLLAAGAAFVFWQQQERIKRLESENAALRTTAEEVTSLREENARLAQARTDPAESERQRSAQLELVRLRGQVAQLRRQLAETSAKPAVPVRESPAPAPMPVETPPPPVETFSSSMRVAVPWKQTLVTGGWTLPSGKRALMFIQPVEAEEAGQVMLQARLIEMPDAVLTQLGMDGMRSDNKQSSTQGLLTSEQTEAVMKALEQTEGVDVISAPQVLTADGRQAQVKVADLKQTASGESYEVGPVIDLIPRISPDRQSVDLTVSAQLKLPAAPAQ